MQGGSSRRAQTAERAFGAGWKIHGMNVYGRSRSQASGNDVMHTEMYVIRLRRRAVCRSTFNMALKSKLLYI